MMRELVEMGLFVFFPSYKIFYSASCVVLTGSPGVAEPVRGLVDQVYNLKSREMTAHCWALDGRNDA